MYELKQHKPSFDDECLLFQSKEAGYLLQDKTEVT
jgi:hypothetical protein